MATRSHDIFTTVRTEGALLPPDLIQRIADGDSALEGLRPADYHLSGEKINEAVNRAWNVLLGAWKNFDSARQSLPSGDLGTSVTRERWLLPLFRELDYGRLPTARAVEIDGKSYSISHRWENVPIHLVSYQLDLDKRAPGVAGAAAASPHSLLQVYLNRSDDVWGFVSNGRQLRILRDNVSLTRQAYVEFDLEAMMNGEVYADFVLLWLLCHQSRVEGERPTAFWLEKWMQTASQEGTRSLDQLRNQVEQAIACLGEGFLAHPHNHALRDRLQSGALIPQDYYRQLLRLVYRLLFLFVAEDRGLLLDPAADDDAAARYTDFYSTRRLRHLAERFRGTRHHDLFHGLRLVMRLLGAERNGEGRALGLPVLGSYLFSDEAVIDLIDCEIGNRDLLEAIRALAFTEDKAIRALRPVDYKNLGPEELGSVYESLLELHPQINVPARTFTLATAGGHERKTTGSYYTPSSLIYALLDSALDPVLKEARAQGEAAILDLKVCDPACGSGHFLIAAAHRMAKALASVRTGEEEPAPDATRTALRDVIGHCLYGVDINPMAVELCKVGLWMEALEPGKPLSFLDHRIQCGNSLLGTTPALMAGGIPDDAFQPIEGDNPKVVSDLRKRNRDERKQREAGVMQLGLFERTVVADYSALSNEVRALDAIEDTTLAGVRAKETRYRALADDPEYIAARLLADAWCAAFVWDKSGGFSFPITFPVSFSLPPLTDLVYRRLEENPHAPELREIRTAVVALRERYQFFHWHVAFPDVFHVPDVLDDAENEQTGWNGGFSVMLGNPPWQSLEFKHEEYFADKAPEIAFASNDAARKILLAALENSDAGMYSSYQQTKHELESTKNFIKHSRRFTLTGAGTINLYALFAETGRLLLMFRGRLGIIVQTSIATEWTYRNFFRVVANNNELVSFHDFQNRRPDGSLWFPSVDSRLQFCLLTLSVTPVANARVSFFTETVSNVNSRDKVFALEGEDILRINPNTLTLPVFRNSKDATLTRNIYRAVPAMVDEEREKNDWQVVLKQGLFNISGASKFFLEKHELESLGLYLNGNRFIGQSGKQWLPVYEDWMIFQYDHRYNSHGSERMTENEHQNAHFLPLPRYWIEQERVIKAAADLPQQDWFVIFRDRARTTDSRTAIFCVVPLSGVTHPVPIISSPKFNSLHVCAAYGSFNSFAFDYVVRQKLSGYHLTFYVLKQQSTIQPSAYTPDLLDFIVPRVLELTYTAWDLQSFAQDVGWDGPPFNWDEDRRFLMRCELDALYFHLYSIARDDVDYIMETFPIVKRKDEKQFEEYRTKRVILEMYNQMAEAGGVSGYQTWLSPGPADPGVAHYEDTRS